jgi:hypothetical protein
MHFKVQAFLETAWLAFFRRASREGIGNGGSVIALELR